MTEETPVAVVTGLVTGAHDWISDVGVNEIYRDEKHIGENKNQLLYHF